MWTSPNYMLTYQVLAQMELKRWQNKALKILISFKEKCATEIQMNCQSWEGICLLPNLNLTCDQHRPFSNIHMVWIATSLFFIWQTMCWFRDNLLSIWVKKLLPRSFQNWKFTYCYIRHNLTYLLPNFSWITAVLSFLCPNCLPILNFSITKISLNNNCVIFSMSNYQFFSPLKVFLFIVMHSDLKVLNSILRMAIWIVTMANHMGGYLEIKKKKMYGWGSSQKENLFN